jgi:hypothetical protein
MQCGPGKRAVSFHGYDGISDDEMNRHRCTIVEDALLDTAPVQDILGSTVLRPLDNDPSQSSPLKSGQLPFGFCMPSKKLTPLAQAVLESPSVDRVFEKLQDAPGGSAQTAEVLVQ